MNKKEFFVVNVIVILLVFGALILSFNALSGESLRSMMKLSLHEKAGSFIDEKKVVVQESEIVRDGRCSNQPALDLRPENDIQLNRLAVYQEVCRSLAVKRMMLFTDFPYDHKSSVESASLMAGKLKLFSQNGVEPLVVIEPAVGDKLMRYDDFLDGKYTRALDEYFRNLKEAGVTDEMMGTWVPFPESNTPNWANKNMEPKDFALSVNRYLGTMKKHFPQAKGSILLNAATYAPSDIEWNNGDYLSLSPYLEDIDTNLVDSFGIQGFPWVSRATSKRKEIFRAPEFLQNEIAIASAQQLRTKDIWINTGTFFAKYASDPKDRVEVSLNRRKAILNDILEVAENIREYQQNEYRVSINLFSEDKSDFNEATDWSYFQDDDSKTLLAEFLHKSEIMDVPVSLSDREIRR